MAFWGVDGLYELGSWHIRVDYNRCIVLNPHILQKKQITKTASSHTKGVHRQMCGYFTSKHTIWLGVLAAYIIFAQLVRLLRGVAIIKRGTDAITILPKASLMEAPNKKKTHIKVPQHAIQSGSATHPIRAITHHST